MQLAVEAWAKHILIPSENKRDVADVPDAILTAIQWQFYDTPTKTAIMAMGMGIEAFETQSRERQGRASCEPRRLNLGDDTKGAF
jgi:hypothetical protein